MMNSEVALSKRLRGIVAEALSRELGTLRFEIDEGELTTAIERCLRRTLPPLLKPILEPLQRQLERIEARLAALPAGAPAQPTGYRGVAPQAVLPPAAGPPRTDIFKRIVDENLALRGGAPGMVQR